MSIVSVELEYSAPKILVSLLRTIPHHAVDFHIGYNSNNADLILLHFKREFVFKRFGGLMFEIEELILLKK